MKHQFFYFLFTFLYLLQPHHSQLIISAFCFNGEAIAFYHMMYLKDVVDYFILIESNLTHSGVDNNFYYIDKYKNILKTINDTGKIIIEKVTFPTNYNWVNYHREKYPKNIPKDVITKRINLRYMWYRENYQRNIAKDIITKRIGTQKFILIVGDADEIPKKELVKSLNQRYNEFNEPKHLHMALHYYSFNWFNNNIWSKPFIINNIGLSKINHLTEERNSKVNENNTINNAGWHCSYFMTPEDIKRKLKSFAHQEYNHEGFQQVEWIQRCIDEGIDLFNRTGMISLNIIKYDGSHGYPYCKDCQNKIEFNLFHMPNFTIPIEI